MPRGHGSPGRAVLLACLLLAGRAASAQSVEPRYLSPAELEAIVEASERTYEIRLIEDLEAPTSDGFAASLWSPMGGGLEHPYIEESEDGDRNLVVYPFAEGCMAKIAEAEVFFERRDFERAGSIYAQAVEAHPDCYTAHLYWGDTFWHRGQPEQALERYERATALNPYTFQVHYFRANALFKLGRLEEARRAYIRALALRPHRPSIEQVMSLFGERLGATYDPWRLEPPVVLEPREDGMAIAVDAASPAWRAFGLCRAVWAIEPGLRQPTESQGARVSSFGLEEHCLRAAIAAYRDGRAADTHPPDPTLEHLDRVERAGLLTGLVFYEIGPRPTSNVMALLPDELSSRVIAYLDRFVLPAR